MARHPAQQPPIEPAASTQPEAIPFGIGLGSNLGERESNVRRGIDMLLSRVPAARLTAAASLYETDPVDCQPGTQSFINTVIEIEAAVSPAAMHAHLIEVEKALGRPERRDHHAPRSLDLDLLYAGSIASDDPTLTLPHPRLHQRRFVLQPLAEIRPQLILPGQTKSVAELLAALPEDAGSVLKL